MWCVLKERDLFLSGAKRAILELTEASRQPVLMCSMLTICLEPRSASATHLHAPGYVNLLVTSGS